VSYSLPSTKAVIARRGQRRGRQRMDHLATTLVSLRSLGSEHAQFTRPYIISKAASAATVHTMKAPRCSGRWDKKHGQCVWFSKSTTAVCGMADCRRRLQTWSENSHHDSMVSLSKASKSETWHVSCISILRELHQNNSCLHASINLADIANDRQHHCSYWAMPSDLSPQMWVLSKVIGNYYSIRVEVADTMKVEIRNSKHGSLHHDSRPTNANIGLNNSNVSSGGTTSERARSNNLANENRTSWLSPWLSKW